LNMSQKDLCRLTNTSRPGVSKGLKELITDGVLEMKSELYMTGRITVRDVDRLKDAAYSAFREDVLGRLPSLL
ncbi:MAG: winged helix-turn-helix domain-containing protein, partial [Armatimonadetes bacterium]|nr:winged helix-turn-helix domain-containing protein [Armatimonadota bacterium]